VRKTQEGREVKAFKNSEAVSYRKLSKKAKAVGLKGTTKTDRKLVQSHNRFVLSYKRFKELK